MVIDFSLFHSSFSFFLIQNLIFTSPYRLRIICNYILGIGLSIYLTHLSHIDSVRDRIEGVLVGQLVGEGLLCAIFFLMYFFSYLDWKYIGRKERYHLIKFYRVNQENYYKKKNQIKNLKNEDENDVERNFSQVYEKELNQKDNLFLFYSSILMVENIDGLQPPASSYLSSSFSIPYSTYKEELKELEFVYRDI